MKINIINKSKWQQLHQATPLSAGYDLIADINNETGLIFIEPGETAVISTGLYVELPHDMEMQIRSRSGMTIKGLVVANSPGTIDSDYRGEVRIIVRNTTTDITLAIEDGDRIAQAVFNKVEHPEVIEVEELSETLRGDGGFGSTGVKVKEA